MPKVPPDLLYAGGIFRLAQQHDAAAFRQVFEEVDGGVLVHAHRGRRGATFLQLGERGVAIRGCGGGWRVRTGRGAREQHERKSQ